MNSSKNLPQLREEKSLNPSPAEWQIMQQQATMLIRSGFLPESVKTPEQAIAIMLKGREVGFPTMQAFSHINVIKGKPALSAEGMMALVFRNCPSASIKFLETSNERCAIEAKRSKSDEWATFSFTMDDAHAAGITGNPSWKKYPRAMLRSRCVSEMARSLFPDCLMGCSYTPEELGSVVDEDGEVIEVQSRPQATEQPRKAIETPKPSPRSWSMTENRQKRLFAIAKKHGWQTAGLKDLLKSRFGLDSTMDLAQKQYDEVCDEILPGKGEEADVPNFENPNVAPEPGFFDDQQSLM